MNQITTIPLKEFEGSSTIKAIGFDPHTETLRIEFKKGGIYRYSHVSQEKYDALHSGESFGKAFVAEVKSHPELHPYMREDHLVPA